MAGASERARRGKFCEVAITCKNGAAVFVRFRGVSEVFAGRRSGRGEWVRIGGMAGAWRWCGGSVRMGGGRTAGPGAARRGGVRGGAFRASAAEKNQKMFFAIVNSERANGAYICAKSAVVRVFRADMAISRNRQFFFRNPLARRRGIVYNVRQLVEESKPETVAKESKPCDKN